MSEALFDFAKKLNIQDIEPSLLAKALTHPSFTMERNLDRGECYERLEFLGDSVLKLCSSKFLYNNYPDFPEGTLTKIRSYLVSDAQLALFAKKMGFSEVLVLSKSESKDGGANKSMILACAFESVLGAIFLTYGLEFCEEYLTKIYAKDIKKIVKNLDKLNPKANLQEFLQSKHSPLPDYKILEAVGPAHDQTFKCGVEIDGKIIATAKGKSKKEAETAAAKRAYAKLKEAYND